MNGVLLVQQTR